MSVSPEDQAQAQRDFTECVWDALAALAPKPGRRTRDTVKRYVFNTTTRIDPQPDTIGGRALVLARERSIPLLFDEMLQVIDVIAEAAGRGLLTTGVRLIHEPADTHYGSTVHYTERGTEYFARYAPIHDSKRFEAFVQEHAARGLKLQPADLELLLEAHHCLVERCFRAAVILVGLVSERHVAVLCETVKKHARIDPNGPCKVAPGQLGSNLISVRFTAAVDVLAAWRQKNPAQVKGSAWEQMPEIAVPLIDALRCARNDGAHTGARVFGPGETTMLLLGLPHALVKLDVLNAWIDQNSTVLPGI